MFGLPLNDAYRVILMLAALSAWFIPPIVYFCVQEITIDEQGNQQVFVPRHDSPTGIFFEIVGQTSFWRLIVLVTLMACIFSLCVLFMSGCCSVGLLF